jgi:rfaE bifunctional protein nucleotidyltransferase chain/domain
MKKVANIQEVKQIAKDLQTNQKAIVLAGGCFDLLHQGHLTFLQKAKEQGDFLIVLLESDQAIKQRKGENRPIHTQTQRADALAALNSVDVIVCLPHFTTDAEYDNLVLSIKPAIIATTAGDQYRSHKERQAVRINAKVVDVTKRLPEYSTTKLVKHYGNQ